MKFVTVQNSMSEQFQKEVQLYLDTGYTFMKDPTFIPTPNGEYLGKYVAFMTKEGD